jgi:hypothetical protein
MYIARFCLKTKHKRKLSTQKAETRKITVSQDPISKILNTKEGWCSSSSVGAPAWRQKNFILFFLAALGFELRALYLQGRSSYPLNHSTSLPKFFF